MKTNSLVYPELSFKLMGLLFKIHNNLGSNFQEKYYQRAIELELEEHKVNFEREKMVPLMYRGKGIGRYFIDFVIEDKIALEVKASDYFRREFRTQILSYLNSADLKLGIITNFNGPTLSINAILTHASIHFN